MCILPTTFIKSPITLGVTISLQANFVYFKPNNQRERGLNLCLIFIFCTASRYFYVRGRNPWQDSVAVWLPGFTCCPCLAGVLLGLGGVGLDALRRRWLLVLHRAFPPVAVWLPPLRRAFCPWGVGLRGAAGQPNIALKGTGRLVRAVHFNFFRLCGFARLPWAARPLALR